MLGSSNRSEIAQDSFFHSVDVENNPDLQLLLNSLRAIVVYVDPWCVVRFGNLAAQQWSHSKNIAGMTFVELAHTWDSPFERQRELMQVVRTGKPVWQVLERSFEDGRERWFQVDKVATRDKLGRVNGALLVLEDVSESILQKKAFEESESRYRALIKNSTDALWHYEVRPPIDVALPIAEQVNQIYRRAQLVECNNKFAELFEQENVSALIGTPLYVRNTIVSKDDINEFIARKYRLESQAFSTTNQRGETVLIETSAVGEIENGFLTHFWGTSRDVTEQKRYLDRMEYLANHDGLTNLPNREYLYNRMEEILKERQAHQKCALLFIDLDRFKEINDTLGHAAGDDVLKQVGPRLQSELGEVPAIIARLGGDEFAIMLQNIRNAQQAVVMGHRLLDAVSQMFEVEGYKTELTASVGVAIAPDQAQDVSTMMRYADIAMYHAKTRLKGVAIYDADFDSHSPFRLELMGALGRAIRENELRLHFQPKVRVNNDEVYGFEALLRWEHPSLGFVPPGEFIPIAETSNVIYPLTVWVMEETVKQCAQWVSQGFNISIAMNLSARNLLDDRIVGDLRRVLEQYNLSGEYLEMEITESMIMSDPKRAQLALERINALGVKLSIDDFGTGYSSLAYLKRLPVQTLKIDCAFVRTMLDDEQDEIIVSSTIQLAHNLGLDVVAEGVENHETYRRLNEMGCDAAQGYFIAKPMDRLNAESWLQQGPWL